MHMNLLLVVGLLKIQVIVEHRAELARNVEAMLSKAPEVDLRIPEIPVDLGKLETSTRGVHATRQRCWNGRIHFLKM